MTTRDEIEQARAEERERCAKVQRESARLYARAEALRCAAMSAIPDMMPGPRMDTLVSAIDALAAGPAPQPTPSQPGDDEGERRAEAETALGNLLAVLHRDGGHRLAEVGAEQAVREAHERWADVVRRADAAEAARASLAAELAALRAAAHEAMRATSKQYSAARRALVTALAATRAAAEAHDAEVRRAALEEAAEACSGAEYAEQCEERIRALASRERGQ